MRTLSADFNGACKEIGRRRIDMHSLSWVDVWLRGDCQRRKITNPPIGHFLGYVDKNFRFLLPPVICLALFTFYSFEY